MIYAARSHVFLNVYLRQERWLRDSRWFVCLRVDKTTRKLTEGFERHFQEMLVFGRGKDVCLKGGGPLIIHRSKPLGFGVEGKVPLQANGLALVGAG